MELIRKILKHGILGSTEIMLNKITTHIVKFQQVSDLCRELKILLEQDKVVVLRPFMQSQNVGACAVGMDVVTDYFISYRTVKTSWWKHPSPSSQNLILLACPLALLRIPIVHDDYLRHIDRRTRAWIRRADKEGFTYREFSWNDYLDDIFAINTSKATRSYGAMRGWYKEPVQPRFHAYDELPYRKYFGVFKGGTLCGYLHLVEVGDQGFFRHFIGHGNFLRLGIMNGLISWTVSQYIGHPKIRWLKYGPMLSSSNDSLTFFKRRAGFVGHATFVDVCGRPDLIALGYKVQLKRILDRYAAGRFSSLRTL
jgi:hypothetical protein